MNKQPKPHMNEFFVRGIALTTALSILARWETISEAELLELGFTSSIEEQRSLRANSALSRLN